MANHCISIAFQQNVLATKFFEMQNAKNEI